MEKLGSRPSHHPDVAARTIEDEAVVVLPVQGEVLVLNEVGTRIWDLVDGLKTVQEIIDTIVDEFDVTPPEAGRDADEFLATMTARQALRFDVE